MVPDRAAGNIAILLIVVYVPVRAFMLQHLWGWFVAPILHGSEMSFAQGLGVSILFEIMKPLRPFGVDNGREQAILHVLDACVPDSKRSELLETLADLQAEREARAYRLFGVELFAQLAAFGIAALIHVM